VRYVIKEIQLDVLMLFLVLIVAGDFITTYRGVVLGSCREFSVLPRLFIESNPLLFFTYPVAEFILLFSAVVFLRALQRMLGLYMGMELVIPVLGVFVIVNNTIHILLGKC
jgi:hypothetical protein